jgi:hypothetical protein
MTIERHFPSGAWIIYELYHGHLVQRRYEGYTKKEAIALFKKERGIQ